MLLSTSSFEKRGGKYWLVAGTIFLLLTILIISGIECYWRRLGYEPSILDSAQLWSLHRAKANKNNSLVFLGASRTQFGIDLNTVRNLLPEHQPVMLATNARYPLATLSHLADDRNFSGIVLLDIDARGMMISNRWMQKEYSDYYDTHWNPNWHVHRSLLNLWQANMAVAHTALGIIPTLKRTIDRQPPPFKIYTTLAADRTGFIDFTRINPKDLADSFARGLERNLANDPPPPADIWLEDLQEVYQWVQAIEQRGGKVIFYEPPVSGRQRSMNETAYPRALYWQAFMDTYGLSSVNYQDEPTLIAFDLPDESHIGADMRSEYTKALIDILKRRGLIKSAH